MKARFTPAGYLLLFVRALLSIFAAIVLVLSLVGALLFPDYARADPEAFTPNTSWTPEQVQAGLDQLGWPAMVPAYLELARSLLAVLVFTGLGLLLLWRMPPSMFTFFLVFIYIGFAAGGAIFDPLYEVLPALHLLPDIFDGAGWQLFFIVFYFFPTGKPVPFWVRWPAMVWLIFIIFTPFIDFQFFTNYTWVFVILVLSTLFSQIYRYFWRSDAVQRQQTKWILALIILNIFFIGIVAPIGFQAPKGEDLGFRLLLASANLILNNGLLLLFPMVVTIAIVRYRLWDIDLVIRRTLVYAVLTALLSLVYFGSVITLQQVFRGTSGQSSPAAVVISTLLIAALFTPLRSRLQMFIDRRFFRRRYDAGHAVDQFSQNLRNQVDLPAIEHGLTQVITDTVQPEKFSLWIRKVEKT